LHELSYWLAAGILNVRAERAIQWPDKQEIAELRLTFIRLKNPPPLRLAIITAVPLFTGVFAIWFIANGVLNVQEFLSVLRSGRLSDVSAAFGLLTAVPDFWLWIYLLFTISNTMVPNLRDLRGGRILLVILGIMTVIFAALGIGSQTILAALNGPVADGLYLLSSIFVIVIAVDVFVTAVLGTIEAVIERITGDSATFENGKLIAMTRAERLEMQRRQVEKERSKSSRAIQTRGATAPTEAGTPSIYKLPLPIPGAPGKEVVTPNITVERESQPSLPLGAGKESAPETPIDDRAGPSVITSSVAGKLPASISISAPKPTPIFSTRSSIRDEEDDEENDDFDDDEDGEDNDDSSEDSREPESGSRTTPTPTSPPEPKI
jgi:hypothetical protein